MLGERTGLVAESLGRRVAGGVEQRVGKRLVQHERAEVEMTVVELGAEVLGLVERRGIFRPEAPQARVLPEKLRSHEGDFGKRPLRVQVKPMPWRRGQQWQADKGLW